MRYKVLVVDDDEGHRVTLKGLLSKSGFSVIEAENARDGLYMAGKSNPDLIISDVSMPDYDGVALCKTLREQKETASIPILLVSGVFTDQTDQAEGIQEGADDYLAKPISPELLLAKVHSVLRRYHPPTPLENTLKAQGLSLDPTARTVSINGKSVHLTRKEFDLLSIFLRKPRRVLSGEYLMETVWGYDPAKENDPRLLIVQISSLRKKLGPKLADKITTVSGAGYRFEGF